MRESWLDNKIVLITGASSGIGLEISRILVHKHNCHIIGIARNEERMLEVKKELGDNFEYRLFDVSIEDNWRNFAKDYNDKSIDILINNAGVLPPFESFSKTCCKADDIDLSDIKKTIDINLLSNIYSVAYLSSILEKSSTPAIINVSSSAGLSALPGVAVYSATKAGVKNFTESLRCERDYYIGLVCPGFTKTNIFRKQTKNMDSKLINFIASDLKKATNKIYKGIRKKKKRIVVGFDAKAMDKLYRLMPVSSLGLFSNIMKSANVDLFEDVFKKENEK